MAFRYQRIVYPWRHLGMDGAGDQAIAFQLAQLLGQHLFGDAWNGTLHDAKPAADGAWSQDYVLNRQLELTGFAPPMAEQLNQLPDGSWGEGAFVVGESRDILSQPCALLRFVESSDVVVDHDFLYVRDDTPNMLFTGGKHVDGIGFYYPKNRPTAGLQQPLIRVE